MTTLHDDLTRLADRGPAADPRAIVRAAVDRNRDIAPAPTRDPAPCRQAHGR